MKPPKIKTSHVRPPIPTPRFDWCAWDDNLGEDASPTGYGRTEEEAIADFKRDWRDQFSEDDNEDYPDFP